MTDHCAITHRQAMNSACDEAAKNSFKTHYQCMRNPVTAMLAGDRAWPEVLTPETVASWIAANVSYSTPWDAHDILKAMIFENNAA